MFTVKRNDQQDIPASSGTCGEAEFRRPREGSFHEQPCGSMLRIRTGTDGRGNIGGSIPEEGKDKRRIGPVGFDKGRDKQAVTKWSARKLT